MIDWRSLEILAKVNGRYGPMISYSNSMGYVCKSQCKSQLVAYIDYVIELLFGNSIIVTENTSRDGPPREQDGNNSLPVSLEEISEPTADRDETDAGPSRTVTESINPSEVVSIGETVKISNDEVMIPVTTNRYVPLAKLKLCSHLFPKKLVRLLGKRNRVNKKKVAPRRKKGEAKSSNDNKKKSKLRKTKK